MKSNFIKYDGSQESINRIQELVNKANKKYNGQYKYDMSIGLEMNGCQQHLCIISTNLEEDIEDDEPNESSFAVTIGYYVFFEIPENIASYSSDFPSFSACVEEYYTEYKSMTEL